MIHIRDFVDFLASEPHFGLAPPRAHAARPRAHAGVESAWRCRCRPPRILRPVLFAPPSMPALDLLLKMQASRTHMALVIDEYGGTDGLVSIEDVVEAIVGDIEDEHDEAERPQIAAGRRRLLPRRGARAARRGLRRRSASISPRSPTPRTSTRSAACHRPSPAACPAAAKSSRAPAISNSKCSTPIRGGSSG